MRVCQLSNFNFVGGRKSPKPQNKNLQNPASQTLRVQGRKLMVLREVAKLPATGSNPESRIESERFIRISIYNSGFEPTIVVQRPLKLIKFGPRAEKSS